MPLRLALDGVSTEIDAVVFDCDGVLLETIPAKLQACMDWLPAEHEALKKRFESTILSLWYEPFTTNSLLL